MLKYVLPNGYGGNEVARILLCKKRNHMQCSLKPSSLKKSSNKSATTEKMIFPFNNMPEKEVEDRPPRGLEQRNY